MKPWMLLFTAERRVSGLESLLSRLRLSFFYIAAFLLTFIVYSQGDFRKTSEAYLLEVTASLNGLLSGPIRHVQRISHHVSDFWAAYTENARLKKENQVLWAQNHLVHALISENRILREKLHVMHEEMPEFLSVRVSGCVFSPYQHGLFLSAGKKDGFEKNSIVFHGRQILGRIVQVSQNFSRVLLITDVHSHVPVILETSRLQGILSGDQSSVMKIKLVEKLFSPPAVRLGNTTDHSLDKAEHPPREMPQKGEYVLSSGQGGIFPAGFVMGRVIEVKPHEILVQSLIDESTLTYVQVARQHQEMEVPLYDQDG